jgi:hypothetical protein
MHIRYQGKVFHRNPRDIALEQYVDFALSGKQLFWFVGGFS